MVIDMEAKADGRALKTFIPHLNPRKLASPYFADHWAKLRWFTGGYRRGSDLVG